MTLVRFFDVDEQWVNLWGLSVRDGWGSEGPWAHDRDPVLERAPFGVEGTVAWAGAGWVSGVNGRGPMKTRVELHAAEPPAEEPGSWDVMETPYLSATGVLEQSSGENFALNGAGSYRIRVLRSRRNGTTYWLLRFWRVEGEPESPRWLVRQRPAVPPEPTGWMELLPLVSGELYAAARLAAETGEPISQDRVLDMLDERPLFFEPFLGWRDADLWSVPGMITTGHPDLDAEADASWRKTAEAAAEGRASMADLTADLGCDPVRKVRDFFPLLVAAGLLEGDASAGYRVVAHPPRARDVLDLPDQWLTAFTEYHTEHRYERLAGDLLSLVLWSRGHRLATTLEELASRLLTSEQEIWNALDQSRPHQLRKPVYGPGGSVTLSVDLFMATGGMVSGSDQDEATDEATFADGQDDELQESGFAEGEEDEEFEDDDYPLDEMRWIESQAGRPHPDAVEPPGPFGAPPRAGMVMMPVGRVTVWRSGEPMTLAHLPEMHELDDSEDLSYEGDPPHDSPNRAFATPYGVVVFRRYGDIQEEGVWLQTLLIRSDGEVRKLSGRYGKVLPSADGRFLAAVDSRPETMFGSNDAPAFLHLVDLEDGTRTTMPWPQDDDRLELIACHGTWVYFHASAPTSSLYSATWRWKPGTEPEMLPDHLQWVDPITGTALAATRDGRLLLHPDGSRTHLPIDPEAKLSPGAKTLYTERNDPRAFTFFDPAVPGAPPRVVWIPASIDPTFYNGPIAVWEDPDHILIPRTTASDDSLPALRLHVPTGRFELVPAEGSALAAPLFIEPTHPTS